ncbi:MAG: DUF2796 domain-containing protein [Gammaproteobacteria bacterium]
MWAAEQKHRQHEPHEHGAGQLHLVIDGKQLQMELKLPGMDVVGFEHEPRNDEQKQALAKAIATLKDPTRIFEIDASGQCAPGAVEAQSVMLAEEEHEHEAKEEHEEEEGSHTEFHARYTFTCAAPDQIAAVRVNIFELFKGSKKLAVQMVTPTKQTARELTPTSAVISGLQ